ncbi:MAG: YidB family protein [Comamonas sp.]
MSLLDSVLSAGAAAIGRSATSESGLLPVLVDLLSPHGEIGGLGGLVTRFEQAGLAPVIQSWISQHAANLPITAEQLQQVLGSELVQKIAARLGIDVAQLLPQLSQFLPVAVDRLTPQGELPQGSGGAGELLELFGNFLKT